MTDFSAEGRPPSVLLVSHHDWLVLALGAAASGWGYAASRAATVAQAIHGADAIDPDVVFVDVWMDRDGRRTPVAAELRAESERVAREHGAGLGRRRGEIAA